MAGPVWGTAEIRVTADGRILPTQIRRIANDAGDEAGTDFAKAFNTSLNKEGKRTFASSFKNFFRELNQEIQKNSRGWENLSHNTRQWTLIIGSVAAALPGLTNLLGAAAAGVLILGSAFTSLGIGAGVAISTFIRFLGDIENVPEEVRPARAAFDRLRKTLGELNGELTVRVFQETEEAWDSIADTVKGLQGPLDHVADAMNGLIRDLATNIAPGTKNFENLSRVIENSARVFDSLIRSVGIFGGALLTAFANPTMVAAVDGLTGWIRDLATGFDNFVNSPAFNDFITRGVSIFENLGGLIESIGNALSGLFDQQTTDDLNAFIDGLTDFFNGPGKSLIEFLDELNIPGVVIDTLNTLGNALKPILDFAVDFMRENPEAVADALTAIATAFILFKGGQIITGIAGGITSVWSSINKMKPSKINAVASALSGLFLAFDGIEASKDIKLDDFWGNIFNQLEVGAGGALIGAGIGSVVPVIGTAVGAIIGAIVALIIKAISDAFNKPEVQKAWQDWWNGVVEWFNGLTLIGEGTNPVADLANDWGKSLGDFFTITLPEWWNNIVNWFTDISLPGGDGYNPWADTAAEWGDTINKFFSETLPSWWDSITQWFTDLALPGGDGNNPWADTAAEWGKTLNKFFTETLPNWWNDIVNWFKGLSLIGSGSNPLADLANDWGNALRNFVTVTLPNWWRDVVNFFSGRSLSSAVGNALRLPGGGGGGGGLAAGGILLGPRRILAGEDGPEAVVPLDRPLNRVNPSVRALSALAQGLSPMASGGIAGAGRVVNIGPNAFPITINGALNPEIVALTTANRIAERVAG